MERLAKNTPTAQFPPGRDPWRDLYPPALLDSLATILNEADDRKLDRIAVKLCSLAEDYVILADEVALEIADKDRAKFIDSHVLRPAEMLVDALDYSNARYFVKWPEEMTDRGHRSEWRKQLTEIISWAKEKRSWLTDRPRPRVKPRTDYRYALVWDLLELYLAEYPDRRPSRTSYNEARSRRARPNQRERSHNSSIQGRFVEYIRAAAAPILGQKYNLNHEIQLAVQKYIEMKKTGSAISVKIS